jgi:release factor glutamine methyltransferase
LLARAVHSLSTVSPTPALDAELLLAHALHWPRARLLAERDEIPDSTSCATFHQLLARRLEREPVAYLVGQREFYGLDMLVDARVLVPRPETELLVDLALAAIQRWQAWGQREGQIRIVDVGTGSGAVAIALTYHVPGLHLYATDLSPDALDVARTNALRHHVADRITFLSGDLLSPLPEAVDMIVSNPPYTLFDEIDPGVQRHEPRLALDGGADGLDVYRALLRQAPAWLRGGGMLLLEIGDTQAAAVGKLARAAFAASSCQVHHDLAGRERVVVVDTTHAQ